MRIFLKSDKPVHRHTMYVTPGKESDSVEFRDPHGKPFMYTIEFINGTAEVPNNLGRWMVDTGRATSLIPPSVFRLFRRTG